MREISCQAITDAVESLCSNACVFLPKETIELLNKALLSERSEIGKENLNIAIENASVAQKENMPICQDTGMVTVFASVGQDVHIVDGDFEDAINEGVRRAYRPFRKSVLTPIERKNTGDNTPAVIHTSICKGDKIVISIAPKGFGSENMSALKMLKPSDGVAGIKKFVVDTVASAGANPCPPVVVGVGIGGTMEKAAVMAKHAITEATSSCVEEINAFENELLCEINKLGIGPQGMGGTVTALAVYIETFPTHIAGLPVAVNIQCHCARHQKVEL